MGQMIDLIETERLLLREIEESDAESIVEWRSNPEVFQYFKYPHKLSIEEHTNWYYNSYLKNANRFDWMCIEKNSGVKIGIFGLIRENEKVEVNYLLAPGWQHRGYATEAIKDLMKYALKKWNCKQLVAEIHQSNQQSIRLIQKLGFIEVSQNAPFVIYEIEV